MDSRELDKNPQFYENKFTMKFLNASREVWIVAAGEGKADAVGKIIEGDLSIPASYVSAQVRTRLIVDQAAFFTE